MNAPGPRRLLTFRLDTERLVAVLGVDAPPHVPPVRPGVLHLVGGQPVVVDLLKIVIDPQEVSHEAKLHAGGDRSAGPCVGVLARL